MPERRSGDVSGESLEPMSKATQAVDPLEGQESNTSSMSRPSDILNEKREVIGAIVKSSIEENGAEALTMVIHDPAAMEQIAHGDRLSKAYVVDVDPEGEGLLIRRR